MIVRTNKSSNNNTIIRKKGRPMVNIKDEILNILKNSSNPMSTSDLTSKLNRAWHTIDRACLMLQVEDKVYGFKIGKMNLWRLKK